MFRSGTLRGRLSRRFADLDPLEERQARLVGGAAAEVDQAKLVVVGQFLDRRVLRRADDERRVQLAGQQVVDHRVAAAGFPGDRIVSRGDVVGLQDRLGGGAGAAAVAADGQAQVQQVAELVDVHVAAVEQPERFLVDRAEGLQLARLPGFELALLAALDQGDVDLAGAEQALQVVARAGARHQLQFEALLLELFPELAGEHGVAAALGAGGHGRAHRRRWGDEIEHRGDQGGDHRDQPEVGADQDGEVLEQVLDAIHERSLCCSPEGYDGCGRAHSSA